VRGDAHDGIELPAIKPHAAPARRGTRNRGANPLVCQVLDHTGGGVIVDGEGYDGRQGPAGVGAANQAIERFEALAQARRQPEAAALNLACIQTVLQGVGDGDAQGQLAGKVLLPHFESRRPWAWRVRRLGLQQRPVLVEHAGFQLVYKATGHIKEPRRPRAAQEFAAGSRQHVASDLLHVYLPLPGASSCHPGDTDAGHW
jgi:hypothetical protein